MHLNSTQLSELAQVAIAAATTAGKYISETRPEQVKHKGSGKNLASQVLTEVDLKSQEIILEILKPTLEKFDLALLTEESPDDGRRLEKDYFWCIDPIDGTLSFINGTPGYATSIALISREGIPQIGVVYDPVEHNLYTAIRDQGAFRNYKSWKIGHRNGRLYLATDVTFAAAAEFPRVLEALERFGYGPVQTTRHGGGVLNAIWALEQAPACYFKFPNSPDGNGAFWDFAASACIYHELGAFVSDIHGDPLELNHPENIFMNRSGTLFATDAELVQKILALKEDFLCR